MVVVPPDGSRDRTRAEAGEASGAGASLRSGSWALRLNPCHAWPEGLLADRQSVDERSRLCRQDCALDIVNRENDCESVARTRFCDVLIRRKSLNGDIWIA